MRTESTKKGKELEKHLSMNIDQWFYIYENYVKNEPEEKNSSNRKRTIF